MLAMAIISLLTSEAWAQSRIVSGTIKDSNGQAIPGVNVLVKGTTNGTVSDGEGKYSISIANTDAVLVFSFIGFATQEVSVGAQTAVDVTLKEDATQLQDVVVTALGIERDKKALGYSVQEVKGADFTVARESNVINNLQGRVAGVQIYKGGTGPGGSSKILIRGAGSLREGASDPLFVVDGVPFDNNNSATNQSEYGSFDQGQGIQQINPDDIETMTVLKGPEAGALYGSRGANGVILITTKKGTSRKGIGATYQSNLTFESPLTLPKMQNLYGQGTNGGFTGSGASGIAAQGSWGPKLGASITDPDWTGKVRPQTIDPDDLTKFLKTGMTSTNSVSVSGGSDKNSFRLGYTNMNNSGLLPNSTIKRDMVTLRVTSAISDRLSADAKISYTRQVGFNRPQTSGSPSNVFAQYYMMPRSIHISDMNPWRDSGGGMVLWYPGGYSTLRNPYWTMYEDFNRDVTDRFLTMLKLEYKITDWLKLMLRNGMDKRIVTNDYANAYGIRIIGGSQDGLLNFNSGYTLNTQVATETNSDFLLTASKTFNQINATFSVGGNERFVNSTFIGGSSGNFDFPGVYQVRTGSFPRPDPNSGKTAFRVNSLYGFMNLSYRSYLFLDASYRNDWTSTLSPSNRSIGYGSVSASLILSEMLAGKLPEAISYLKVRGGFAQTGNFIGPYSLVPTFSITQGFNNAYTTATPTNLPNPNVRPEKTNSFEVGLDMKFLQNRIGFEVAYYAKYISDQILNISIPSATGYSTKTINAGEVQNTGIEFVISGTPVKTSNFSYNLSLNFNHNVNKVNQLTADYQRFLIQDDASARAIRIVADVGRPMGDIYGRDFSRDAQGRILVDPNTGLPLYSSDKNTLLGNYQPQFTLGFVNNFSYKNFNLGFVIDVRQGGKIYSQTQASLYAAGNAEGTLANRDGGLIVNGVHADGSANTTAINAQQYWTTVAGFESVASLFTYDASNVRLREATLTYNFPATVFKRLPINRLSFGLVGRNLWLISSHMNGLDPESTFTTTNAQGYENGTYPSMKSIGFNLNVGF